MFQYTGVMRRRVDLRWRISPEEISAIASKLNLICSKLAPQQKIKTPAAF